MQQKREKTQRGVNTLLSQGTLGVCSSYVLGYDCAYLLVPLPARQL